MRSKRRLACRSRRLACRSRRLACRSQTRPSILDNGLLYRRMALYSPRKIFPVTFPHIPAILILETIEMKRTYDNTHGKIGMCAEQQHATQHAQSSSNIYRLFDFTHKRCRTIRFTHVWKKFRRNTSDEENLSVDVSMHCMYMPFLTSQNLNF